MRAEVAVAQQAGQVAKPLMVQIRREDLNHRRAFAQEHAMRQTRSVYADEDVGVRDHPKLFLEGDGFEVDRLYCDVR